MEISFDNDTINKLNSLNEEEGYVIEHVRMQNDGEGVILQLEKQIIEDENE